MIGLLGNWFGYSYAKMAQLLSCKFCTPPFYIRDKNSRTLLQSLWETGVQYCNYIFKL